MRKIHAIFAEFRWTIRVIWPSPAMFLTLATCHLFENPWRESVITTVAVSHGACRYRLHFEISRKICNFAHSFCRLSCVAAYRILLYTNIHHQMGQQEEPVIDTCSLGGKQFRWAMHEPMWYVRSVYFVSVLFLVVFCAVLFYLLY